MGAGLSLTAASGSSPYIRRNYPREDIHIIQHHLQCSVFQGSRCMSIGADCQLLNEKSVIRNPEIRCDSWRQLVPREKKRQEVHLSLESTAGVQGALGWFRGFQRQRGVLGMTAKPQREGKGIVSHPSPLPSQPG